jgi:hypothetical protein
MTWYEEDEILSLLHVAGFASSRIVESPRAADAPPEERRFAAIAAL